ncbi:ChaN family lipoprotein [Trichloromonas sp.]|uniref:ChaN family lipoprotein n=1 Tax=Trichloromonas sp. TaxID=3069249 RepID=UPI002A45561B|nr:ChaN family lipoprotein [Trichloromonas sp.]
MFSVRNLSLVLFSLALCACAPKTMTADPEQPYPLPQEPQLGQIVHLPTGMLVDEARLHAIAGDARIVYVGETHDNPASHRQQVALLRALAERHPGKVALGMEMFVPSQQPILDRWSAGELSEKAFLKESRWYETWRMDFDYYRELLELARNLRIPVLGLNVEKNLVAAVRDKPTAELAEDVQRQVPEMDLEDPYQKAMTKAILGDHGQHGAIPADGFHRVQTLWDETMAESIVRYLSDPDHGEHRLMVIAGGNHVRYGFGIPRRVFRRLPTSYVLVGSTEIVVPEDKKDRLMNIKKPQFPMVPYDFLLFTEYEDLGKQEVKLGVMLGESKEGLIVEGVMPASVGETAGLQKGDRILAIDGEPVVENFDLIYEVKRKKPGDHSTLKIQRNGKELEVPVEFVLPPAGDPHGEMPKK